MPKRPRLSLLVWTVAIFAVLFFILDFAAFTHICRLYEGLAKTPVVVGPSRKHEAIVVLTGDHSRIPKSLELLRSRRSQILVISGAGKGTTLTDLVNQQQGESAKNIHEVWQKIIMESVSSSTIENAVETRKILDDKKIHQVILVTSDYHMPRSLAVFQTFAPEMNYIPYPVLSETGASFNRFLKTFWEYWKYVLFKHRHSKAS